MEDDSNNQDILPVGNQGQAKNSTSNNDHVPSAKKPKVGDETMEAESLGKYNAAASVYFDELRFFFGNEWRKDGFKECVEY